MRYWLSRLTTRSIDSPEAILASTFARAYYDARLLMTIWQRIFVKNETVARQDLIEDKQKHCCCCPF